MENGWMMMVGVVELELQQQQSWILGAHESLIYIPYF